MKWFKNIIGIFLCKIGLHKWEYFRMSNKFLNTFPEEAGINRRCKRCKFMQCITNDGKRWTQRI